MTRRIRGILVLWAAFASLAPAACFRSGAGGCGGGPGHAEVCRCPDAGPAGPADDTAGSSPVRGGQIVVHLEVEPPHLLGLLRQDASIYHIIQHDVVQALVREDAATGAIVPELAETWEVSEDLRHYRFNLRPGVVWHDGQPFTAEDVRFTFEKLLDPRGGAGQRSDFDQVTRFQAADSLTFEVELSRPDALFLYNLESLGILPQHVFGGADLSTHPAMRAPVGTGPFRFRSWQPGESIVLERFDRYWGKPAWLDRVIYRIVLDKTVALQMMRRGEIDLMPRIGEDQFEAVRADPVLAQRYRMIRYKPPRISYVAYNVLQDPFRDQLTRLAMARLVDRPSLNCSINRCLGEPLSGVWPVGHACTPADAKPIGYDPQAARRLLDQAGWRDANGDGIRERNGRPFAFSLLVSTASTTWQRAATVLQQDLRRAGIRMDIVTVDWSVFLQRLKDHAFDAAVLAMSFFSWENVDVAPLFSCAAVHGGQNYGGFCSPAADRLLEGVRRTQDVNARRTVCRDLTRLLYREQPVTFLNAAELVALVRRQVHGVTVSDLDLGESGIWVEPGGTP